MTIVLTYGTFDLFHIGHLRLLERAKSLGSTLYVGISSDEFNSVKGKKSIISFEHRARIVRSLRCVDDVFAENDWNQKEYDIGRLGADILVMGDDWLGRFDKFAHLCSVQYLPRTEGISSTEIKSSLKNLESEKISELQNALETIRNIVTQLGQ